MLINVRVLKIPQTVGGIGGSIITAREIGDFPLVLKNKESGKVHLRLIRNVLISPDTGANLLGTNCLNTAGVGFDAPPSFLRSKAKLYIPCRDGTREEFALPKINGLWSVPDSRHVGLAEIPQSAYRAFLQKLLPSDAPRSHQLRALTELEVWHIRLNHAHPSKLAQLSRNCIGIKHPLPDVRHPCHSCQDANATRSDAPPPSTADHTGVWHVDVMDLGANHLSLSGYRYISVFTVATSRLMCIELHKTKDEFLPAIQRAITRVGHMPTILRSDGAGEYFTEPVNRYLLQEHIKKETANAREQSGNGRAETLINSLGRGMRVSLYSSGLPFEFWGFAAINWADVYNHLPHSALKGRTPWEAQYGTLPDVSWFRPFGCRVTVFRGRDEVAHHKLAPRGEACVYVGLGFYSGHKGWLCYSPRLKRLFCTRHCRFDETFMPMRTHDQRILGFYDSTPRRQMLADQFGNPDNASAAQDELDELPLPFEPEVRDAPAQLEPDQPFYHAEADHFMDASAIPAFPSAVPSASPAASTGNTTQASGGPASSALPATQASGGQASNAPGQPSAQASGGPPGRHRNGARRRAGTSGGANSGSVLPTPSSSAGEHELPAVTSNAVCINQQYLSDDFDWQALGSRRLDNVNNFELTEWLIGQGATLRFDKALFFPEAKEPGKYLKGHVYDTTEHRPPRAKIAIHRADGTEEAVNLFIIHERREDVIRPNNVTVGDVGPDNITVSDVGPTT
jgi:hypothetical protein